MQIDAHQIHTTFKQATLVSAPMPTKYGIQTQINAFAYRDGTETAMESVLNAESMKYSRMEDVFVFKDSEELTEFATTARQLQSPVSTMLEHWSALVQITKLSPQTKYVGAQPHTILIQSAANVNPSPHAHLTQIQSQLLTAASAPMPIKSTIPLQILVFALKELQGMLQANA